MSKRLADNACDLRIAKKAFARARIQLLLDLFAEEFFEAPFIRRRKSSPAGLLRSSEDILALGLEFLQDGSRKRIGEAKSDEVNRVVRFPVRQPATRSDCCHTESLIQKSRQDAGATRETTTSPASNELLYQLVSKRAIKKSKGKDSREATGKNAIPCSAGILPALFSYF